MSNVAGVPSYTPPVTPDYVGPVAAKIESQIGRISDMYKDIAAIMKEIAALDPPQMPERVPGQSDASWAQTMQKFQQDMQKFQSKLQSLNSKLHSAQSRLHRAQMVLQRLQNSELPAAERKQANEIQRNVEDAQRTVEEGIKAAGGKANDSGASNNELDRTVSLRVVEERRSLEIDLDGASFSELVSMLSLAVSILQASPNQAETSFTKMPSTPGSGLPPIDVA